MTIRFQCPICKGNITKNEGTLVCNNCSSKWEIKDGIPIFSKTNQYFGEILRKEMIHCIKIAEKCGWRSALFNFLRKKHPWVYKYATDPSRADWRFLLPTAKRSVVLDVGCGWGNVSFSLAQESDIVIAMDITFEKVKFLDIRRKQEKITNIYPVCADVLDFPFPENYFDTIIMNGVLEWVGCLNQYSNPQKTQEKALQNIFNGLKENGHLYIGIENRYGFNYFLGARDPHSNLPFTSILPRRLANLYSQMTKGENYRTYTYSYEEYIKILSKAGFSSIKFYCPLPDYREPRYIIPLDNSSPFKYLFENIIDVKYQKSIKWAKLIRFARTAPMWVVKHLVPSYSIICKKRNRK